MMVKLRIVASVVAFSMLVQVPVTALAGAQQLCGPERAPVVATSAAPLTAAELAKYVQLQEKAQQAGVLAGEKGGADEATWTIVGIVVVAAIALGIFAAVKNAE